MPANQAFPMHQRRSIKAWRLHQREQFVDRFLRGLAHLIGLIHSSDVDSFHHRSDLIAKIGEKTQWIRRVIGDTRNQAGDQQLAGNHPPVQFIHYSPRARPHREVMRAGRDIHMPLTQRPS